MLISHFMDTVLCLSCLLISLLAGSVLSLYSMVLCVFVVLKNGNNTFFLLQINIEFISIKHILALFSTLKGFTAALQGLV